MFAMSLRSMFSTALLLLVYGGQAEAKDAIVPQKPVVVGDKVDINESYQIDARCAAVVIPNVEILVPPQHGQVLTALTKVTAHFVRPDPLAHCRKVDGITIFYEPTSGFFGHDSVLYRVSYKGGKKITARAEITRSSRPEGIAVEVRTVFGPQLHG